MTQRRKRGPGCLENSWILYTMIFQYNSAEHTRGQIIPSKCRCWSLEPEGAQVDCPLLAPSVATWSEGNKIRSLYLWKGPRIVGLQRPGFKFYNGFAISQ
jgi:hypothetical protein